MLRRQRVFGAFVTFHLLTERQLVAVGGDGESTQVKDLVVQSA